MEGLTLKKLGDGETDAEILREVEMEIWRNISSKKGT